jgi:diaminohydroxyphosphoribosylaminopyrimidine deaminase/5-amino-6-(5-phosphoribosylamino)uracil reductase
MAALQTPERTTTDRFMRDALTEARRGLGRTHPNPPVGAAIVRDGIVIGRGYHRKVGLPHAEVDAIAQAGENAQGADLYVTLEPCNHFGRTPPCTQAILDAGIRRVYVGAIDPNPKVSGLGVARLRSAGTEVLTGVLQAECEALIQHFARHVTTGLPYVVLKAAATLDGKIATSRGDSRWVTGQAARKLVHRWRDELDAVLVGAGTVRTDDPLLTTRLHEPVDGREPRTALRVVVAGMGSLSADAKILNAADGPVIIAVPESKVAAYWQLTGRGAELLPISGADDRVDVPSLLRALGKRDIMSVMVEGGSALHAGFLRANAVDEIRLFIAPRITGGDGLSWTGPLGTESMALSWRLEGLHVEHVGEDVLIMGRPRPPEG